MDSRFSKKPGDKSCVMFGCVNEETSKQSSSCTQCAEDNPKLFKACIKEGSEFLSTGVGVSGDGKTFTTLETLDEFKIVDPLAIKKAVEGMKKRMGPEQPKPEMNKSLEAVTPPKMEKKKTVVRDGQAIGVLETAKKLLVEGKSYKEVLGTLIGIYMNVSRDPKKSKHNAQSTVFNALKRLKLKKANNDLGYEKI